MHLCDAQLDASTGNPIIQGQIRLDLRRGAADTLPRHTHILLDFSRYHPATLSCRAIDKMAQQASGFYDVTTLTPHIDLRSLGRETFSDLLNAEPEAHGSLSGPSCGAVYGAHGKAYEIDGFERTEWLGADGMKIQIAGRFGAAQLLEPGEPPAPAAGFEIRGLIPWETLKLCGFAAGGWRHHYVPTPNKFAWQRINSLEGLDPFSLRDLRLGFDLSGPLAAGHLRLSAPPSRVKHAAQRIVTVDCGPSGLEVSDADRAQLGEDGFCIPMGYEVAFGTRLITRRLIEDLLEQRDRAALALSGDGIGSIRYDTGYADEPGDPLGHIGQDLESLDFHAELSKAGLRLQITATLRGFDPEDFERHRRWKDSRLVPWTDLSAEATMPWSLLQVTGSPLADRRTAFDK